ncbi:MAG: ATP-dependent 6-phosphofructokinase [Ignavibacteria bacterium]|nr:ATP-dependent 6-phosphofructokinase [Bacteroidota bacterium]MSQ46252.1 ATP-dependent 6-phosphofructokinase [Ignavibacteria bacterium]
MELKKIKRIGILTGGGDCPGLNAVIRGITKPALTNHGITVIGIEDGFEGFIEGRMRELSRSNIAGIISLGGTILGSSNKGDPFHFPTETVKGIEIVDASHLAIKHYKGWGLDCLIAIGGDGTMHISEKLSLAGLNIIGVPKTIDNDLSATDQTFGYDTALSIATEAIDRLHTTGMSHHRVMVIEVMGRYAGWIALEAGLAGGADVILIPEIPFKWEKVFEKVIERSTTGKKFSIICVAEGAKADSEDVVIKEKDIKRTDPLRFGGIGEHVARRITEETGLETRATVLGHLQRGGTPTAFDRILSTRYGTKALELAIENKFGHMVSLRGTSITSVLIKDAILKPRLVPKNGEIVTTAKLVGTSFGD